jgi:hypothetical protein
MEEKIKLQEEIIKTQGEYIKLLQDENAEVFMLAVGQGWYSTRIVKGKELREKIEKLNQLNK